MWRALHTTWFIAVAGLLGASAFNPDNGILLHHEALWRTFGIAAYVAGYALPLLGVIALTQLIVRAVRRAVH
jgi:hypothetical protein